MNVICLSNSLLPNITIYHVCSMFLRQFKFKGLVQNIKRVLISVLVSMSVTLTTNLTSLDHQLHL